VALATVPAVALHSPTNLSKAVAKVANDSANFLMVSPA